MPSYGMIAIICQAVGLTFGIGFSLFFLGLSTQTLLTHSLSISGTHLFNDAKVIPSSPSRFNSSSFSHPTKSNLTSHLPRSKTHACDFHCTISDYRLSRRHLSAHLYVWPLIPKNHQATTSPSSSRYGLPGGTSLMGNSNIVYLKSPSRLTPVRGGIYARARLPWRSLPTLGRLCKVPSDKTSHLILIFSMEFFLGYPSSQTHLCGYRGPIIITPCQHCHFCWLRES